MSSGTGTGTTVGASGTNAEFYTRLRNSIINETDFDTITTGSGGDSTLFSITSSTAAGASDNGVLSAGTGDTFVINQQTAGGVTQAGATDGHWIQFPDEATVNTFRIIIDGQGDESDGSPVSNYFYVTSAVGSDEAFWDNLSDKIKTVTNFDNNYINNGDGTATFHPTGS